MPSNVSLFLSVLAGYSFVHFCYFTRFRAQRHEGHRLVIESAYVGLLFYLLARVLQPIATLPFQRKVTSLFGTDQEAIDTLYILALGLVAPLFVNVLTALVLSRQKRTNDGFFEWKAQNLSEAWDELMQPARKAALDRAIRKLGNDLLALLHEAANRPKDRQMPVLLTLDNNKIYVGWVVRSPNLKVEDKYLSLLPLASGYRDKDTLKVQLNVLYPVHEYSTPDGKLKAEDFVFVVPYESIKKANFFDVDLYQRFFEQQPQAPAV